ncbi:hypothetical protein [Nonomuraea insulae]|uniref:Uncharacterized protein n=1 Tax=Nonomuraea insulae TaxID=1616787 RepID=A0ABW1D1G8_9ACTN
MKQRVDEVVQQMMTQRFQVVAEPAEQRRGVGFGQDVDHADQP